MFSEVGILAIKKSFEGYSSISRHDFTISASDYNITITYKPIKKYYIDITIEDSFYRMDFVPNGVILNSEAKYSKYFNEVLVVIKEWLSIVNENAEAVLDDINTKDRLIEEEVKETLKGTKLKNEKFNVYEIADTKVLLDDIYNRIEDMMQKNSTSETRTEEAINELKAQIEDLKKQLYAQTKKEWLSKYIRMIVTFTTDDRYRKLLERGYDATKEIIEQISGPTNLLG